VIESVEGLRDDVRGFDRNVSGIRSATEGLEERIPSALNGVEERLDSVGRSLRNIDGLAARFAWLGSRKALEREDE
jgi:hypothetical protein